MERIRSTVISVLTRATRRHIPEEGILHRRILSTFYLDKIEFNIHPSATKSFKLPLSFRLLYPNFVRFSLLSPACYVASSSHPSYIYCPVLIGQRIQIVQFSPVCSNFLSVSYQHSRPHHLLKHLGFCSRCRLKDQVSCTCKATGNILYARASNFVKLYYLNCQVAE
jgi:hypothetical protein